MTTRRVLSLLLFVLAPALVTGPALARQTLQLDGTWQCAFGEPASPPGPDAAWEPVTVPSTLSWRPDGPHALWYHTSFYVPPNWSGRRVFLTFDGIKYRQQIHVNGTKVGEHTGGFEPTEYDITDQTLVGGTNELLVSAHDWTALLAPDADLGPPDPAADFGSWVKEGLLAPLGSQGWQVGIWGSVSVEARPRVWVADVLIAPSVRKQTLRVDVSVRNGGSAAQRTVVSARVAAGGEGPRFTPRMVLVPPGQEQMVTLEAPWPSPRLWSPQDPHRYSLVVGARTGGMGDSVETGFGFREVWVEGARILLNGTPITLLATAAQPTLGFDADPFRIYQLAQSAGCNAISLRGGPWPSAWYDAADEWGMLVVSESALWRLSSSYALSREEFWKNADDHLAGLVKRQRNHPSVVIWSAESSLLSANPMSAPDAEARTGRLADTIRASDPTRPIMFGGDLDPAGKADIVNLHYPRDYSRWHLWPQAAFWFDSPVQVGDDPAVRWKWDRSKPLYLGESGRLPDDSPEAATILFGDTAFPELATNRMLMQTASRELQTIAARDAGVAGICPGDMWGSPDAPNPDWEARSRAYSPIAVVPLEASTRFFAGTVVDRTLMVFNDTPGTQALDLRWRVTPIAEAWEVSGSAAISLPPAGRSRVLAALALPPIAAPDVDASFLLELWSQGQLVFSSSQDWKLYRREALSGSVPGAPRELAVYDPVGDTTRLLQQLGISCLPLTADNARRLLHFTSVAVVGKGAFAAAGEEAITRDLRDFVENGGLLLVFEQERYPADLIPLALSDHDSTMAFPRLVDHPALADLDVAELSEWLPDGIVGRREVVKPARGGFLALVDSGSDRGLQTAGLAEFRLGAGRMLLCQLDVTTKFGFDPAATKLVRNLLAHAAEPRPGTANTGVFCDDSTAAAFDAIGLEYDRLAWPLPKSALRPYGVLLVCNLDSGVSEPARLQQFVREGGRALLHAVTPQTLGLTQRLLEQPLVLQSLDAAWVTLNERSGPAAAMSNQELAWLPAPPALSDSEAGPAVAIANYALRRASQIAIPPASPSREPTYHTIPGVLVSAPLGRGLWVVDQVRWHAPGANEAHAKRYLAALLTNLGCRFRPPIEAAGAPLDTPGPS